MTPRKPNTDDALRLVNQTVVLELHIKTPSFQAAVPPDNIMDSEDKADRTRFHVNKQLIDRKALRDLQQHRTELLTWLWARRVPCSVLANGMHLVPLRLVQEIDATLTAYVARRGELVDQLLATYDELVVAAQERLAGHFNQDDYPAVENLRPAFAVTKRFLSMNVPAALEQVNKELYERESARVTAEWAEAAVEVRGALREGFAKLVAHLADRLTPDEDGKPKTFQASTVTQLQEFMGMFNDRNITNDADLSALVKQAQELLRGTDPKVLRQQETTRERVLTGFTQITEQLSTLGVMIAAPRRVATAEEAL